MRRILIYQNIYWISKEYFICQIGLGEVERIRGEMLEIVGELGEDTKDLKAFIERTRKDPRFYYKSPQEVMDRFREILDREIEPKLSKFFWNPPQLKLE